MPLFSSWISKTVGHVITGIGVPINPIGCRVICPVPCEIPILYEITFVLSLFVNSNLTISEYRNILCALEGILPFMVNDAENGNE